MRTRGLIAVAVAAAGLAGAIAAGCSSETPHSTRAWGGEPCGSSRLFAPDSVWNACMAEDAAVDPASESLVADLVAEVEREGREGTGPFLQADDYSTPLYVVPAGQATVRVALDDPGGPGRRALQRAFAQVPIPAGARPAAGTDAHMTVWQPSSDSLWEFWRARRQGGRWRAAWGGAIQRVSESPGYYDRASWPGLSDSHWGASASSLPVIGGTILISELKAGRIEHALALALPAPRAGEFAWPAQRTDGMGPADAIPEGARLRLDPDLDLDELGLPATTLAIARAAQRHGIIVRDQTGVAIGFYAEDPVQEMTNPYQGRDGFFGGESPVRLLAGFPWESLEVTRMRLCSGSRGCPPP